MRLRSWKSLVGVLAAAGWLATAQAAHADWGIGGTPLGGSSTKSKGIEYTPVTLEDDASAPCTTCDNAAPCDIAGYCCPPSYCSIVGGAEATFLFPHFRNTGAGTFISDGVTSTTSTGTDINGNLIVAPRVWLGVQGERWGLVGRYWNAQSWGSGFGPTIPVLSPAGIQSSNAFGAYLADLEVQRRFLFGPTKLYGLFGVRYGSVRTNSSMSQTSILNAGNDLVSASTWAGQSFNGTGITMGFWGTRDLGCSPFSLFFSNRYSVLWGNGSAGVQTATSIIDPAGSTGGINNAFAGGNNGDLFIAEFQIGGQWQRRLVCIPATAFLRCAFEYQYWNASQGLFAASTTASGFIGPSGSSAALASATSGDLLFNMLGVSLGAGIMY